MIHSTKIATGATGKSVNVPIFIVTRSSTVTSRERNESKPGIKTRLPFLKNITEESDLENFQDLVVALDACLLAS